MTLADLLFSPQGIRGLDLQSFDCGRESVNKFFREEAQDYQDELFGKTYFWVHPDRPTEIVAGFTVANASVFTKHLPNARQKKNLVADTLSLMLTTSHTCWISISAVASIFSFLLLSRKWNTATGTLRKTARWRLASCIAT